MPKRKSNRLKRIIVISGGTGRLASHVLDSALAQFPDSDAKIVFRTGVRTAKRGTEIVERAAADGALICHSLVDVEVRKAVNTTAQRLFVPCIDVLGPALTMLGDHLASVPRGRAGLMYELHREQVDRMDAMDFTLAHDDGRRVSDLKKADVVLVGASRTSKSVTCFYLAFRGVRTANVPLIPNVSPPSELLLLDPRRVVGLTMNAAHLESIRQSRLDRITNEPVPNYADLREIQAELRETRALMSSNKWECIDVSYKATEEVAEQVLQILSQPPRSRSLRATT